jgi:hypothetical protein
MSAQLSLRWNADAGDRTLLAALVPFKARSRGRRIKDLALLGLLAEQAGLRIVQGKLVGLTGGAIVPAVTMDPSPPVVATTQPAVASGLDDALIGDAKDMLKSLGIEI